MSKNPENRFGNIASGDLETEVAELLCKFDVEPFGQQTFTTTEKTLFSLWFDASKLTAVLTEISDDRDPYRTLAFLESSNYGFSVVETLVPRQLPEAVLPDEYSHLFQVVNTATLDYVQLDKLCGVIDSVIKLKEGDLYDPQLEQVIECSQFQEEQPTTPSKWEQRMNRARRSAGFVLTSLNQVSSNPVLFTAAASRIVQQ